MNRFPLEARPRAFLLLVSIAVLVLVLAQAFLGALLFPLDGDQLIHTKRLQSLFQHGWYVPTEWVVGGQPLRSGFEGGQATPFVYGPAFTYFAHLVSSGLGVETWSKPGFSETANQVRNILVLFMAVGTAAAVVALVRIIQGSLVLGVWAAAALFAIPEWLNHSFFNLKDIPVAAGYTWFSLGLVISFISGQRRELSWRVWFSIVGLVWIGVMFTFGVRTALWAVLAASLLLYGILSLLGKRGGSGFSIPTVSALGIGVLGGVLTVVATYPRIYESLTQFLTQSVSTSGDYPWESQTRSLIWGAEVGAHPPWWYLPGWFAALIPLGILLLVVIGVIASGTTLRTTRRQEQGEAREEYRRNLAIAFPLLQALMVLGGIIVLSSNVYGGIRQVLFILPAFAVFAAIGLGAVLKTFKTRLPSGWIRRWGGASIGVLVLVVPAVESTALFPDNGSYISPVASIGGVENRFSVVTHYRRLDKVVSSIPQGSQQIACAMHNYGLVSKSRLRQLVSSLGICPPQIVSERKEIDSLPVGGTPSAEEVRNFRRLSEKGAIWVVVWPGIPYRPPVGCQLVREEYFKSPTRGFETRLMSLWRCERVVD